MIRLMMPFALLLAIASSPAQAESTQSVSMEALATKGEDQEVVRLLSEEGLSIVQILLRNGKTMDEHSAEEPATIHCVSGSGVLIDADGRHIPLEAGVVVLLPPGKKHVVKATPEISVLVTRFAQQQPVGGDGGVGTDGAEEAAEQASSGWSSFPEERIFARPLADQKQPRAHVTYQAYELGDQEIPIASVGYGIDWGFFEREIDGSAVQIGVDGAVFAIFNLDAPSNDLINADYFIGIPIDYRRGAWSARLRPFHLSSHLGDEFLLYPQPRDPVERINVSFEAVEAILSWDSGSWRIYGGGFSIFNSSEDVMEDRIQGGIEFRGPRFGRAGARWVAGLDMQDSAAANTDPDFSLKAGIELVPSGKTSGMQLLVEYYDGRPPHGQFALEEVVEYFGVGVVFVF